jgi:hypothetical protein
VVRPLVTTGAGFLLAVLWFDLMFDVQVLRHRRPGELPEEVLASIARYYRRVTTDARPMNRLVALAMLVTEGAVIAELARDQVPTWVGWASLVLAGAPMTLAAVHTVPSAVRLGARTDPADAQSHLARTIFRDHVLCVTSIFALIVAQLAFGD